MATDVRTIHFLRAAQEKLFQGYQFLLNSINHSEFVKGITVEIPQSGAVPDITKNRTSFPVTVEQRTDTKKTYDIDIYDIGTVLLTKQEAGELTYNKAQSIMTEIMNKLNERIGMEGMYNWSLAGGSSKLIATTGDETARGPGTSTDLKALTLDDLADANAVIDKDNFPRGDNKRHIICPADVYHNFIVENKEVLSNEYMDRANLPQGAVTRVMDFNVFVVPNSVVYSTDGATKRAVGATASATDAYGIIAYHQDAVCHALRPVEMTREEKRADYGGGSLYYGDLRFAATSLRTGLEGIVTLYQGT